MGITEGFNRITAGRQRSSRAVEKQRAQFLADLFRILGGTTGTPLGALKEIAPGARSITDVLAAQLGIERPGAIRQAQLAQQEQATRRSIEGLFASRGLLGSGAELATQAQARVTSGFERARVAASESERAIAREAALQAGLLGIGTGVGGLSPILQQERPSSGSLLAGLGGRLAGGLLTAGLTGGGSFFSNIGSLFGAKSKSAVPTIGGGGQVGLTQPNLSVPEFNSKLFG